MRTVRDLHVAEPAFGLHQIAIGFVGHCLRAAIGVDHFGEFRFVLGRGGTVASEGLVGVGQRPQRVDVVVVGELLRLLPPRRSHRKCFVEFVEVFLRVDAGLAELRDLLGNGDHAEQAFVDELLTR